MIVNWNLLKHPVNWVIVLLMLLVAAYGGHLLLKYYGASPAEKPTEQINRQDISGFNLGEY
jgi:hypothetical protein